MIHDDMLYDPITEVIVVKTVSFKASPPIFMQCLQRLTVNYDTPGQCLNFNQTDFYIHSRSASRDLQIKGGSP